MYVVLVHEGMSLKASPFLSYQTKLIIMKKILLALSSFNLVASNFYNPIPKNPVIQFTPENLSEFNVGTFVINTKADVVKKVGYAATVTWKIVYQHGVDEARYGLCNVLTDGWTHWIGETHADVCEYLNNNPHGETFRVLTLRELNYIINQRGNGRQLVRTV